MNEIIKIVCDYYKIEPNAVLSKSRKEEVVKARFVIYYLIRKNTTTSYQKIGNKFKVNHASVMHGVRKIDYFYEMYEDYRKEIRDIYIQMKFRPHNEPEQEEGVQMENMYREIIGNLLKTNITQFTKLGLDDSARRWIYKDFELSNEQIQKIEKYYVWQKGKL